MSWDIFSKSGIQYLLTKLKTIMMDKRDFVELTKAQYDALPDTKLTDGKYYFLTDVNALTGNIDDSVTTSTDTWSSSKINTELGSKYDISDTAETTLSDNDTFPFYDDSASAKKKSTWSNIVAKIKSALGIENSGSTFLKKDGTWGTPTNTTYAAGTGVTISGTNNAINVTYGTAANTACQGNDSRLSNARTPTSHASTGTGYGVGNASNYGHVKLSDTYNSSVGAAANSIGASQKALYDVYTKMTSWNWYAKDGGSVSTRLTWSSAVSSGVVQVWYGCGIAIIILDTLRMTCSNTFTDYTIASNVPAPLFGQTPVATAFSEDGKAVTLFVDTTSRILKVFPTAKALTTTDALRGQIVYPTSW